MGEQTHYEGCEAVHPACLWSSWSILRNDHAALVAAAGKVVAADRDAHSPGETAVIAQAIQRRQAAIRALAPLVGDA